MKTLDSGVARLFKEWTADLEDKYPTLSMRLERPLLVPTVNTTQLTAPGISVNFDWQVTSSLQ
jgi:hypothetical protein